MYILVLVGNIYIIETKPTKSVEYGVFVNLKSALLVRIYGCTYVCGVHARNERDGDDGYVGDDHIITFAMRLFVIHAVWPMHRTHNMYE